MGRPPNTLHPLKIRGAENRQKAYKMRMEGHKWPEITEACGYKNDLVAKETVRQVILHQRKEHGLDFQVSLLAIFTSFEVDLRDLEERYEDAEDWKQKNDIFRLILMVKERMVGVAQILHKDADAPSNVMLTIERPEIPPKAIDVEGKEV